MGEATGSGSRLAADDVEESIYRVFEPKSERIPPQPRQFLSTFSKKVREDMEAKRVRYKHRELKDPKHYLKRGEGGISSQAPRRPHQHSCVKTGMPQLPKQARGKPKKKDSDAAAKKRLVDDIDFYKAKPYDFNFRVHNIKMVSKQMTRYPPMRVAHTRKGDTFSLMGSGLFPTYVYSEKYGKVPTYIVKRAEEMALAKQASLDAEANKQPKCRYITQHERLELLEGLKANWEQVTSVYNKQSVLIDNASKVARKARLESELVRLEKDILSLEGHPYIYVHRD
ncbi:enkurin-like [Ctenocephalides felis]|uniref:enkurin-like n=1 Tax=Ctenocephalides felis TaxID=7515 RepID=UPI000E6E4594|nr:enkurin-like [Ctenocephalides felis]